MIKLLVKCLNENPQVNGWLINETTKETSEQFYVIHRLETTRATKTCEYVVTVYHKFESDGNKYLGSSSFVVSHKLSKAAITELINDAVYAASFIKNKEYELVKNVAKKTFKEKENNLAGFELLSNIAKIFFDNTNDNVKFNSLELFYEKATIHILNSNGVNLKKTLYNTSIEAIPSYNGEQKVELYQMFRYKEIDFEKIKNDAIDVVKDVTTRYLAKPIKDLHNVDVILRNADAGQFFDSLIENYSYAGIYKGATNKKIGDSVQPIIKKDAITISQKNKTKANAFDGDGVLVKPTKIIEKGVLKSYYGGNQYANYLGVEPTGIMSNIIVNKGSTPVSSMFKKPYLEIIALSGIQIETYSDYVGGEVRLAIYFDGKDYYPVSGFSFSGQINKCLETITLSKETTSTTYYEGPKYIKLNNMEIL